jgi:hypothetical protein
MTARCGTHFRGWPSSFRRIRSGAALLLLGAAVFCNGPAPRAAASAPLEYDVKAAFLLNFTKFVEWPASAFASPDAPLNICILGGDPFGRAIDQLVEGESVNQHRITVERIRSDQPKACQVLFVGNGPIPAGFSAANPAVLTVGEGEDFIRQGGVIAFVIDNRRVRFDISVKAATNAGLKLSSKLLSVARSVDK